MGFPLPWPHGYVPTYRTVDRTVLMYDVQHVAEANDRLLAQFKGKPRIEGLLAAFIDQVQWLETAALWPALVERWLSSATLVELRRIAHLVDVRGYDALPDDVLRRLVLAWVRALRSDGSSESLIDIARLFVGTDVGLDIENAYPAAVRVIEMTGLDEVSAWLLGRLIRKGATAGVRTLFEFTVAPHSAADTFELADSVAGVYLDTNLGLGWSLDPTIGGVFAGVTGGTT